MYYIPAEGHLIFVEGTADKNIFSCFGNNKTLLNKTAV